MNDILGTVYNVRRVNTTKTTNVGDFKTLEEAREKMLEHFKATPKRGNFEYIINEEELQNIGGTIMRVFTMNISGRGKRNYYKRFDRAELDKEARA